MTTDRDDETTWRDLALQFDGHRIEALSLLRYVSESRNCAEATGRASEIKAFLSKPPLSGEAVLAQRIAALDPPPDHGGGEGRVLVPREPTEAMLDAHYEAHATADTVFADARDVWAAMLSAAPTQESEDGR